MKTPRPTPRKLRPSARADQRSRACFRRRRSRVPAVQPERKLVLGSRRRADSDGAISHRARCRHGGFASEPITPTVKRWPASSVWSLGGPTPIAAACAHPLRPVLPSRPNYGSSSIRRHHDARRSGDFSLSSSERWGGRTPRHSIGSGNGITGTESGSVSTSVFATDT
jgi:hypothetical protein